MSTLCEDGVSYRPEIGQRRLPCGCVVHCDLMVRRCADHVYPRNPTTATAMQAQRPLTPRQYEQRRRDFYEATAPITKAMGDLLLLQPFKLTMVPDGHVERETLWLPGCKELFDQYAEMVDWYAQHILGRETP